MKKLLLITSLVAGISLMAQAQITQKSPGQRAAHTTKVLQRQLSLTPDQASQVQAAYLSQAIRLDSLKNNLSADKRTNSLSRKTIMLTTQRQVLGVLNNDQQRQFMQWEQMQKQKRQQNKPAAAPVQG